MQKENERDEEYGKRDPVRFWGGVLGVSALALAAVIGIVVQLRAPKPQQTASRTQTAVRTPAAAKATVKPSAEAKPVAAVTAAAPRPAALKPQAALKAETSPRPLSAAERRTSEELWVEQRKLDADARAVAAKTDGQRRVVQTLAKQLRVPEKLVTDLRGRKLAYGELTVALALSHQLVKRDKVSHQRAVDTLLEHRKAGQGWAAIARDQRLSLGAALAEVKKAEQQLAKLDPSPSKTRKG
jgi:hypothetical protein